MNEEEWLDYWRTFCPSANEPPPETAFDRLNLDEVEMFLAFCEEDKSF